MKKIKLLYYMLSSRHPLGTWVTVADDEITANHIPFVLHEDKGEFGTLVGHVARGNLVWQNVSKNLASTIIFQGDHAYISPSWYPSKHEHGKAVLKETEQKGNMSVLITHITEAYRQGAEGAYRDTVLLTKAWQVDFSQSRHPSSCGTVKQTP